MGKMMGNKHTYFIEMTDTFGGEANYCWVNRFIVSASSPRGAMRRVCTRTGDSVRFQYGASDAGEPSAGTALAGVSATLSNGLTLQRLQTIRTAIPESR